MMFLFCLGESGEGTKTDLFMRRGPRRLDLCEETPKNFKAPYREAGQTSSCGGLLGLNLFMFVCVTLCSKEFLFCSNRRGLAAHFSTLANEAREMGG